MKDLPEKELLMNKIMKTIEIAWDIRTELHKKDIDNWLTNFSGHALCNNPNNGQELSDSQNLEQHIALFMLCNFVFYSKNEIKRLLKLMFEKYIHSVFTREKKNTATDDDINDLLRETQFSPLGSPSESSSYLLYHFRQENDLSKKSFSENLNINKTNVVFVDDFSISGSQAKERFEEFVTKCQKEKKDVSGKYFYMLLMVTTEEAMKLLTEIPNMTALPCIIMDNKSRVFSDSSIVFEGYKEKYKTQAKKMCEYYGEKLIDEKSKKEGMNSLGFGGDGYIFGSYYNIPNNTLPIFWSEQNNWKHLLKRYDKKYGDNNLIFGGRYV
ncbi:MAG: hypothetical protein LBC85_00835 [Fibromonadaceae bacterium]|jgi:thymidylate kinase|nr:hypothetical protein [Fibromonadaceae bacterium]